ncbi:MAG: hypothetical protein PSV36_11850 [Algoriphagus sp.]|nr:hypothetical protein [Algoriphagus sp.]
MMHNYPELNQRILEMAEGDEEFRIELTRAIYNGLMELQSKYCEGLEEENETIIQQIRHKLKPTLSMFEFSDLIEELQNGKDILESKGFGEEFVLHFESLNSMLEVAVERVFQLTQ